jgi:hypothetical protein
LRLHHKEREAARLRRLLFDVHVSLYYPLLYALALGRFSLSTEACHEGGSLDAKLLELVAFKSIGLPTEDLSEPCTLGYVELDGWLRVLVFLFIKVFVVGPLCHLPLDIPGWPVIEVVLPIGLSDLLVALRPFRSY